MKYQCNVKFNEAMTRVKRSLTECPLHRETRSATWLVSATKMMLRGVTNFISAVTLPADGNQSLIQKLLIDRMEEITRTILTQGETRKTLMDRAIALVSPTHDRHTSIVSEEVRTTPLLLWGAMHVHSELVAGASNLRALAASCKNNTVAIKELSELLDTDVLAEIEPEETILERISLDENHQLRVKFKLKPKTDNLHIVFVSTFACAILIIVILLVIIVKQRSSEAIIIVPESSTSISQSPETTSAAQG